MASRARCTTSLARRLPVVLGGVAVAVLLALTGAAPASASCAPVENRAQVAAADAAFVGTVVAADGDRYRFAVEQPLKGVAGASVDVVNPLGSSSEALRPRVGERLGLTARRTPEGVLTAIGCDTWAPEVLAAAAASAAGGRTSCAAPQALPLVARRRADGRTVRLSARVAGGEPGARATIAWGDGRTSTVPVSPSGVARTTVRETHRYARPGRRRITLVVVAAVPIDCGSRYGYAEPRELRSPVRVRTVRTLAPRG